MIPITTSIKQRKPGNNKFIINLKPFENKFICIVEFLKVYIERTSTLRKEETQLFISFHKPPKAVSRDTITRWIKSIIQETGIDVDLYKAHSTRSASSSYAKQNNTTIEDIIKTAGWENNNTCVF